MAPAEPLPDRVLSASSAGLLVLVLPLAFLASAYAGASLAPDPDSARSQLAVPAAVLLLGTAVGSATAMSLRRRAGHPRSTHPPRSCVSALLGVCAAAAPLVQAATGGQFRWALSALGAVGVVLVLLAAAAYRPGTAPAVAVAVAVALVGTALVRDRPQGDLQGPPPATSPGQSPGTPPAAPPR